jgi:hypothetical protein
MKYVLLSHPEPTLKSEEEKALEDVRFLIGKGDLTSANIRSSQHMGVRQHNPIRLGRRR